MIMIHRLTRLSHFLQNLGDAQFESGKALSTMDRIKDTIRDYNTDLEAARSEISADIPRHLNSMGTNMQRYKRAVQESFEARGLLDPSELKYDEKKTDNADAALRDSTTGKTEFDQVPTGEWITRRKTPQDWRHMRKNGISPLKPRRRCRMSQLVSEKEEVSGPAFFFIDRFETRISVGCRQGLGIRTYRALVSSYCRRMGRPRL